MSSCTVTGNLCLPTGPLPTPIAHSTASGRSLVSNGQLGIDLIRLAGGDGFVPHTQPGDHLLICVAGEGTVTYGGAV
jgi:quercetin dioxygenase-like cupin family protein